MIISFRFLKNIMGLWMIQSVKKEIGGRIWDLVRSANRRPKLYDSFYRRLQMTTDSWLLQSMTEEVQAACSRIRSAGSGGNCRGGERDLQQPRTMLRKDHKGNRGDYRSDTYDRIHVVGGGANAGYLNDADRKGIPVCRFMQGLPRQRQSAIWQPR